MFLKLPFVVQVWRVADVPSNDKFQYTHFAHKINSFNTAPNKLLPSDSRLRPDRYALEMGDMGKAGTEKSRWGYWLPSWLTHLKGRFDAHVINMHSLFGLVHRLEEKQRAEKKQRERLNQEFTPKWFRITEDTVTTPWGDLEIYEFNGKYMQHRAQSDVNMQEHDADLKNLEFNPWQFSAKS